MLRRRYYTETWRARARFSLHCTARRS